jgi:uncharacterized protein YbjT (DUF2867 family)
MPAADYIPCDFMKDITPSDWLSRLRGVDAVINAVGMIRERRGQTFDRIHRDTPCALFDACVTAGVKRIIQISALGADERATSRFHRTKKEADDYLASLDLDWVILYPSIVIGRGGKSTALFSALAALPIIPTIGDGAQLVQPIYVDDLICAIVPLLKPDARARVRLTAVGPEPISMEALLDLFRQWLGLRKTAKMPIPISAARAMARLGDLAKMDLLHSETVQMLLRGSTATPVAFTEFIHTIGFKPKHIEEALRHQPSSQADRWQARLYFLKPVLRVNIGLVWLAGGVTSLIYPRAIVDQWLAAAGLTGSAASVMLYTASILDIALGIGTISKFKIRFLGAIQIVVMAAYSIIIAVVLPEFWLHPFGPLVKNIPLAVATLVMMALEES